MRQPGYFKKVRDKATERWEQLESDPDLAGPWRQLFFQVQSPRHVVSELLQNADDAGATCASVEIDNGQFVFTHNGFDFDEEQFASLCRFGFSNKRNLHTIGFRGVGFKSTFSLGDEVHLVTPTLSVSFAKQRFTEPRWTECEGTIDGLTEVRVNIQNHSIRQELESNLQEWRDSPASLLFFNNLRSLRIEEQEIRWESRGNGPFDDSEWMSVSVAPTEPYLVIRSHYEEFPEDALDEIKNERMATEDDTAFPPCRVEIVVGMEGRLFVVLPTGVKTQLPFGCNAPFIQDPARMKIKDPASSPTNAWLLERAGQLAADGMLAWVKQDHLAAEERCRAYGVIPDVDRTDRSIEGTCGTAVEKSFEASIETKRFLLTESGHLVSSGGCFAVPRELLEIWPAAQVSRGFSNDNMPILSRYVSAGDRVKLANWNHVANLSKFQVLEKLRLQRLPCPASWPQLLRLWDYVSDEVSRFGSNFRDIRIVPVKGKETLCSAGEVVRLGQRGTLERVDWEFLSSYLLTIDQDWVRLLQDRRNDSFTDGELPVDRVRSALSVLQTLRLNDTTGVDQVLSKVTDAFFSDTSSLTISDCVRLAHISAKLSANLPDGFRFVTQDGTLRSVANRPLLADIDGSLDQFVDELWYRQNTVHDAYSETSETCTDEEWRRWVRSPASRLRSFVPITSIRKTVGSRAE